MVLPATLLLATDALAQIPSPTGNLYGTALDPDARLLPGVKVTLTGPREDRTTQSDSKGDFHFLSLSPGSYTLTLEVRGLETVRRDVVVALGKNAVLSISMHLAGVAETVIVSDDTPVMDSRKTETGADYSRDDLDEIPTTRDPWGVLRQVPGVLLATVDVGSARTVQQPIFVGKGSHPEQNTYNLDGIEVTGAGGGTPLYFDFDSLDGIAVATGGSDPSLSTPGVTLNLVSKRGTNQLRGAARALYTDGARWDYGIEAGGPLWKDRVWLWGAGAANSFLGQTFYLQPNEEAVRYQEDQEFWNAKLSAQPIVSNSLTLSYVRWQRLSDGRGAQFGDRSEQSTWDNTFPAQSFRLEDSQVISKNLFASAYFSHLSADNIKTPKGGLDTQADLDENAIWHNSFYQWDERGRQRQAGLTASAFFTTGDLRHELKFGFGYRQVIRSSLSVWPADQLVGDKASGFASITRAADARLRLNFYDTHVGDTVAVGNLTLNVGARFDYQQGRNLSSSVPANPTFPELLPAVQYGGDSGYPMSWRAIQPRVGASYRLGKHHRTLVRASYAQFASRLGLEIASLNAFPGQAALYYNWTDPNGDGRVQPDEIDFASGLAGWEYVNPDDPASPAPINEVSKDLEPSVTDEFIVGVEHQFSPQLSASVAYTHRWSRSPLFSPLIGTTRSGYGYIGNATGTALDPATGFVLGFSEPYYGLADCPEPCAGTVLQNRPDTRETYDGIELQLVKRFSRGWMLRASFAYNDWQQHIGPSAIVDPNNATPGSNANGPVVDSGINATWQLNVSGAVQLPLGIRAGLNFFGRQGFPVPYWIKVDAFRDGEFYFAEPEIQIGLATDYRMPNVYVFDFQLAKDFRMASRVAIGPVIDCFNLLNSRTVLGRNGRVGTYDARRTPAFEMGGQFNSVIEELSGRTFRLGVRISF